MAMERDGWSTTADSNTAVASINIAELCDPGNLNNGMRAMMAALANQPEVAVASAGTADVLGADSNKVRITGTTTITSLGTGINRIRLVRFTGALTLTHNATSLILPGGANITTAAGDTMIIVSDASSNVRVWAYQVAASSPFTYATGTFTPTVTFVSPGTFSSTYAFQTGRYVRNGRSIFVYIFLSFTPTLGTASGNFRISGLPFSATSNNSPLTISNMNQRFNWSTGYSEVVAVTTSGETYLEVQELGDSVSSTSFNTGSLTTGTSHTIAISGVYEGS